jgi:hypothetical protein
MALQKGSSFLDSVKKILDRIIESGIPVYLAKFSPEGKEFFKENSNICKTVAEEYYVLTMNNMQSAF